MYPTLIKNTTKNYISTFCYPFRVGVLWLPNCGNWCKSCCSWVFLAGISLSASTSECFEFASLQPLRFLPFSLLLFPSVFPFLFCYRAHQRYPKLKLSMRTTGILVSLWTDFLWKFDRVYRRWNVFCVSCWHSNRYYTKINQGTVKCTDTTLIHETIRYHFH